MHCCKGWHSLSFPQAIDCPSQWSDYCPNTAPEAWASSGAPLAYLTAHEEHHGYSSPSYMLTGTEGQILGSSIQS